jgi:hypothetical protein
MVLIEWLTVGGRSLVCPSTRPDPERSWRTGMNKNGYVRKSAQHLPNRLSTPHRNPLSLVRLLFHYGA